MEPLHRCLRHYQEQKQNGAINAPTFILYHDTDEYIFPMDRSVTILQALEKHNAVCCTLVGGNSEGVPYFAFVLPDNLAGIVYPLT